MLDVLLKRIAERGEPVGSRVFETMHSRPFAGFQETGPKATPQVGAADSSVALWKKACIDREQSLPRTQLQSSGFSGYGALHLRVAEVLWAHRRTIRDRVCHLLESRSGRMLAEVQPSRRRVMIRRFEQLDKTNWLILRELPISHQALNAAAEQDFDDCSVYALMWYLGQASPAAAHDLPLELMQAPLVLRKLPPVEPRMLAVRHLALLYRFSVGPLDFAQLVHTISDQERYELCADLTSLYLTGCFLVGPSL